MGQVVTPAFYAINVSLRLFTTRDFLFSLSLLETTMGLRVRVHKREFLPVSSIHQSQCLITKNNHSGRKARRYYVLYRSDLSQNTVASNIAAL